MISDLELKYAVENYTEYHVNRGKLNLTEYIEKCIEYNNIVLEENK